MPVKIATTQFKQRGSDKEWNLAHALELADQAAAQGAKAVTFPDYFLTDCPTIEQTEADVRKIAETIPGPTTEQFAAKARQRNMYIVAGSMVEIGEDGKLYSTAPILGPKGQLVGKVRKTHPENAPAKYELSCGITPWNDYHVFDTEIGKIAVMLDMDGTAIEVPRILGLMDADIIFWPINFSVRFLTGIHFDILANSAVATAYCVASSRIGWRMDTQVHDWAFMGEARVDMMYGGPSAIAFGGTYVAIVPDFTEGVVTADCYPEKCAPARAQRLTVMPLSRRPETYKRLLEP